jgi:hypothetical protein
MADKQAKDLSIPLYLRVTMSEMYNLPTRSVETLQALEEKFVFSSSSALQTKAIEDIVTRFPTDEYHGKWMTSNHTRVLIMNGDLDGQSGIAWARETSNGINIPTANKHFVEFLGGGHIQLATPCGAAVIKVRVHIAPPLASMLVRME